MINPGLNAGESRRLVQWKNLLVEPNACRMRYPPSAKNDQGPQTDVPDCRRAERPLCRVVLSARFVDIIHRRVVRGQRSDRPDAAASHSSHPQRRMFLACFEWIS